MHFHSQLQGIQMWMQLQLSKSKANAQTTGEEEKKTLVKIKWKSIDV